MNKQAREILMRGGKITKEERNLLRKYLPFEWNDNATSYYFFEYTRFYLKEAYGYCVVYDYVDYYLEPWETKEEADTFFDTYKTGVMYFYDLTRQHKFSSYEDLLEYSFNVNYDRKLIDPRNDPAFSKIFHRGYMHSTDDYKVFEKYIKYMDYSEYSGASFHTLIDDSYELQNITAVIPLGNTEECRIKIEYYYDCNPPFKHMYSELLYEGGFSYSVGGIIMKDFTT